MPRITGTDGNVIAADFRRDHAITVRVASEVVYQDENVILMRTGCTLDGKPAADIPTFYLLADLKTGAIAHL